MASQQHERIEAVVAVAARWQDPDHPPRTHAVDLTLEAASSFTEEGLAFAINQCMHGLTAEALRAWLGGQSAAAPSTVGIVVGGLVPLGGMLDWLAAVLMGHRYVGLLYEASPFLLPAFVEEVAAEGLALPGRFVQDVAGMREAEACIGLVSEEERAEIWQWWEGYGRPRSHCHLRTPSRGVAVLDGREDAEQRERLAEDALLYDGKGARRVGLVWAPEDQSPDPYLDAFSAFRGVFPAHPALAGSLKMQQAYLDATGAAHAFGDDLSYLVSRGAPEWQPAGHLRWVTYRALEEVETWLAAHPEEVDFVTASPSLSAQLRVSVPVRALGEVHRLPLGDMPEEAAVLSFLAGR